MSKTPTLTDGMEAVARNLRDFGYSGVTAQMIREIYDAWKTGKEFPDLPHGVIGAFASEQFKDNKAKLASLPEDPSDA